MRIYRALLPKAFMKKPAPGWVVMAGLMLFWLNTEAFGQSASSGKTISQTITTVEIATITRFHIPVQRIDTQVSQQATLAVSLDNYDISHFATQDATRLDIALNTPIAAGRYQLIVQVFNTNGEISTLVDKPIQFVNVETSTSAQFSGNAFYRVDEQAKSDFAETVHFLSESALQLQASRFGSRGSVSAVVDVQHLSESNNTLNGDEFELPNYLIEARRNTTLGELGLKVGHHNIGQQNLVFNQYHRRGLSAGLSSASSRYGVQAFSVSSEPQTSYRQSVVTPRQREERSHGVQLYAAPFKYHPDALRIEAGYIDGESQLIGTGINYQTGFFEEIQTTYGGKSWNVTLDSFWWQRALWLHAERAWSDFDADGFDTGLAAVSDDAADYLVRLSSDGTLSNTLSGIGLQRWSLSLSQQTVGKQFFSLANLTLPGDINTQRAQLEMNWASVQMNTQWLESKNNVDDLNDRPDQTITQLITQLNYSPLIAQPDSGIWRWLGQPSFGLQVNRSQREQPETDALLAGYDLDDATLEYQLSASFSASTLQWSLQHSEVDFDNDATTLIVDGFVISEPLPDNRNRFTTVSISYTPSPYWTINPSLQWSRYSEQITDNQQDSFNASLQTNIHLLKDRLVMDVSYAYTDQNTRYGGNVFPKDGFKTELASIVLNWYVLQAKPARPGLALSLRSSWNRNESATHIQPPQEGYQILLGVQLSWQTEE